MPYILYTILIFKWFHIRYILITLTIPHELFKFYGCNYGYFCLYYLIMSNLNNTLKNQRTQYDMGELNRNDLTESPITQFENWYRDALSANCMEANAMNLATVDDNEQPSSRIVLLKGVEANGFVFFTNYNSRKAIQMTNNGRAALNFFWPELARQVRIEGELEKITADQSNDYFALRPRESQLGAWASAQSEILESREFLIDRLSELEEKYRNLVISRPEHWGGYLLTPHRMEFWQGRPSRLHDRFQYLLQPNDSWQIDRLSP